MLERPMIIEIWNIKNTVKEFQQFTCHTVDKKKYGNTINSCFQANKTG